MPSRLFPHPLSSPHLHSPLLRRLPPSPPLPPPPAETPATGDDNDASPSAAHALDALADFADADGGGGGGGDDATAHDPAASPPPATSDMDADASPSHSPDGGAEEAPAGRPRLPRAAATRGRAAAAASSAAAAAASGRPPPQKWVQCATCSQWRRVPYELGDDAIPDDWTCAQNVWDPRHADCTVPQALTDDQIDAILALQDAGGMSGVPGAYVDGLDGGSYDDDDDGRRARGGRGARGRGRGRGRAGRARAADDGRARGAPSSRDRGRPGSGGGGSVAPPRARGAAARAAARGARGRGARVGTRGGSVDPRLGATGGLSEAAEALLGMGFGADGDDDGYSSDGGARRGPAYPPGPCPFRPGDAVWAKVEGHDWWPARVARRRAVPHEVGPPPGGPSDARTAVPVVFFTAAGIPGELKAGAAGGDEDDDGDGGAGNTPAAAASDSDEAEFAWLPGAALRPFEAGPDGRPPRVNPDGAPSADATLAACVAAAAAALATPPPAPPPADGVVLLDAGDASDSDGGWAAAADGAGRRRRRGRSSADGSPPPPPPARRAAAAHRGRRPGVAQAAPLRPGRRA